MAGELEAAVVGSGAVVTESTDGTGGSQQESVVTSGAVAEGASASGQQSAETQKAPAYDPKWYEKDDRWTKRKLWKSPDDIIKSYYHLDKEHPILKEKFTGLEKQVNEITGIFKENGIEPSSEQIKSVLGELKTLKDPSNLTNKRSAYLGEWLDDEANLTRYGQKINDFFEDLKTQKLLDDHPGLTREQATKQANLERKIQELEQTQKSLKDKEDYKVSSERAVEGLKAAEAFAKESGFTWSDEIKNKLIKSCLEKQIPTDLVQQEFMRMYGKELVKSLTEKVKQDQLKEINKGKSTVIPAGGSSAQAKEGKASFRDAATKIISGMTGSKT